MTKDRYQLVRADDSRKWHWYELGASGCFCGNVKEFTISEQVEPGSFGGREISKTCKMRFRAGTRT